MSELEAIISFLPNYLICVDRYVAGGLEGKIFCGYKDFNSIEFKDLHELTIKIDKIMDLIKCPESTINGREFKDNDEIYFSKREIREAKIAMRKFDTNSEKGQKATFILQIRFRQNASWQGTVKWVEKKKTLNFRSALELIKIIDSACEEGYEAEVIGL